MKKTLSMLGLVLLVGLGTFLVMGPDVAFPFLGGSTADTTFQKSLRDDLPGLGDPPAQTGSRTSTTASREEEESTGSTPDPDAPGHIQGRAVDGAGIPVAAISVDIIPGAGKVTRVEGRDWLIENVPPGEYQLTIWAEGFTATRCAVEVLPGRRTWKDVSLRRGVVPAGVVVDETNQRPVANALIEFSNVGRTRSDASGKFQAPYTIPQSALDRITVSHPEYDRYTHIRQPTFDPTNIRLSLSRGRAHITGRLLPSSETFDHEQARLRLYFTTSGRNDLRREKMIPVGEQFTISHVHQGVYGIVVDFPGSTLPEIHREILIRTNERKHVDIEVGGGSVITGKLLARAGRVAGLRVELINDRGLTVAAANAGLDGLFKLLSVPKGTYRMKVWYGNPWFNTQTFPISGTGTTHLTVDCDRQRLK